MPKMTLAKVGTDALKKEIQRRLEALPKLIALRDELNRQIAELGALGAPKEAPEPTPAPAPKKRGPKPKHARRAGSLASALAAAVKGKETFSVVEAAEAVLESGYQSKSRNFTTLVSMVLSNDKQFERVARGVYRMKA